MKAALVLLGVIASAGCGSGSDLAGVSGTVSFDGEPVADGQISFEPRGTGRMGVAVVADGRYRIAAANGLAPGKYLVRITASRPSGRSAGADAFLAGAESRDINVQFIPPKYNAGSQLEVDLEAVAENLRDFQLRSD